MALRPRIFFAAAALAALVAPAAFAADHGLTVELGADRTAVSTTDDVTVRFTMTNNGASDRRVYAYDTPLRGVESNLFEVRRDGEEVTYLGYIAKRGAPTKADFVRVGAGKSVSATVELTRLYDMYAAGTYTVQYRGSVANLLNAPGRAGETLDSEPLTLELRGESRAPFRALMDTTRSVTPTYVGCSSTRQTTLGQAIPAAETYAKNAYSLLLNTALTSRSTNTRYKTWFGAYTSTRWATAQSHFQKIRDALVGTKLTINCGCTQNYYAYVYPTQPYQIWVCNAFWNAPLKGTDSKAGTLVHELSHFNILAATDDHAYGHTAAKNLAITNPTKALDNADNHEYFSEY